MKHLKALISLLLSLSLCLSLSACKEAKTENKFVDAPFWGCASRHLPIVQGAYEFDHSVYPYYERYENERDEIILDWAPVFSDHISFTFYYGWGEEYLDNVKLKLGTNSVPATSIYFEKDGERYFVKTVEKEFISEDFKYFASPSRYTITSFNHHEHLVVPFELYNYDKEGSFSICVYYETEAGEQLLTKASVYFERHGEELWFANNPEVFDNYN